jgi:S1-C subfamily serine protease
LVGGTIDSYKLNSYAPLAGNYCEAEYSITWQVYDKENRKVIYSAQSTGSSRIKGVSLEVALIAFKACFRNFLSDASYVRTLDEYLDVKSSRRAEDVNIRYYKTYTSQPRRIVEFAGRAVIAVKTEVGHGSGFVFNEDGYAITSYHVVQGVNTIDAIMHDGKIIQTKIITTQPDKDLAIIKLSGSGYDYLAFGDVSQAPVGSTVYAIGAPVVLELAQSVSRGVVSGYRDSEKYTLVQTDATVNPGNSGGPLIDESGRVIGIVALKIPVEYGIEGLGFGISINDAIECFNLSDTQ